MSFELFNENFKKVLIQEVLNEVNQSSILLQQAFTKVIIKWLGYDDNDDSIVDGAGDRGIDFWYASGSSFEIYQIKSHELTEKNEISDVNFDKEGVNDLRRIKAYLLSEDFIPEKNSRLKKLKERWGYIISSKKNENIEESEQRLINVKLRLIVIGNKLTNQAQDEFNAFKRENEKPIEISDNIFIQFNVVLYTINDIIELKWREENREWKNIDGIKQSYIDVYPEDLQWLKGTNSAVFYCPVINLVNAYTKFGYQLFEPNVRCNIKVSKINSDIKKSILHTQSRKEFKFLNNGVTIICKGYSNPNANKPFFRVNEPGIVNGLQSVVSVSEAYQDLPPKEKQDFEDNCFIMVRLLRQNAVKKIEQVVRATNTQNTMEPRNLLSNNPEQILYEKLFANMGWFFERKQGAWNAFSNDPIRWRTLNNKRKPDFQANPRDGRSKNRTVDNEEIAQSWFSFIGFSNLAVHEKSEIFEKEDRYQLIFLRRTRRHSAELDFNFAKVANDENLINLAPSPELLLCSFLARRFAKEMTPSPKENFERTCVRLGINIQGKSKDEIIQKELLSDSDYLLNSALSGMSFTFVEYFGYLLYRAFGEGVHNIGEKLLSNGTFNHLKNKYSFNEIKDMVVNEEYKTNDILCVAWFSFKHVINEMLCGYWGQSLRNAPNRSRFVAEKDTRSRIIKTLEDTHRFTCKTQFAKLWATDIKQGKGFYGFIQDTLN